MVRCIWMPNGLARLVFEHLFLTRTKVIVKLSADKLALGCEAWEGGTLGYWAVLLLVLGCLWVLQTVGTYFQMSHYRRVLGGITARGSDGFVGVGNAKSRFGKGVILILVVDRDGFIERALKMHGRTVFARFEEAKMLVGLSVDELRDEGREGLEDPGTMAAARRAVEQIDRIRAEKEVGAGVG